MSGKHTPGKLNWNVAGIINDTVTGKGVATACPRAKASQSSDLEMQANAERLAHCWNLHDELVEVLQVIADQRTGKLQGNKRRWERATERAIAVLAKAKETK